MRFHHSNLMKIKVQMPYLRHNICLQVYTKDHWFDCKHSLHTISGNTKIIQILSKGLPSFFNATSHQTWLKRYHPANILSCEPKLLQVINLEINKKTSCCAYKLANSKNIKINLTKVISSTCLAWSYIKSRHTTKI